MKKRFDVGDLVCEQHFPDRIGVVLKIFRNGLITVRWQRRNPNNANRYSNLETIESRYLDKAKGEIVYNETR
tara:strand:- start:2328 stop:2543 length:216 start_codon:yes stop_codon:yes gene_type:complete